MGESFNGTESPTEWLENSWRKRGQVHRNDMVGPRGLELQTSTVSKAS